VNTQKVITFADLDISSGDTVTSLAIDTDVTAGTLALVYDQSNGQTTNAFTYDPAQDASGTSVTAFTYTATNANGTSTEATVTIDVGTLPTAATDTSLNVNLVEDTTRVITVTELGLTAAHGTISALTLGNTAASKGTVTVLYDPNSQTTNAFQYVPNGNANGTDEFTYTATNEFGTTAEFSLQFTIGATNDLPVANAIGVTTDEDNAITITLSGTDVEGSALSFIITSLPTGGSLTQVDTTDISNVSGNGHTITDANNLDKVVFTPTADLSGTVTFQYKVNDGTVDSATSATVTVTINSVDDKPSY
jgi:hypothetical protein